MPSFPEACGTRCITDSVGLFGQTAGWQTQADCLAGVWANHAEKEWQFIEEGDVEAAMQTASAIGDDRLQRQSQGYVVPDAFTHGSSQQRTRWFMTGLKSGEVDSCDTFGAERI
jgi:uncharacterized protein